MLGLFKKTEKGVKRSKEAWWGKVTGLFQRPTFDETLWDDLEELLFSGDVGVSTTARLLDRVRDRVNREHIKEGAAVYQVLKDEMVSLLNVGGVAFPPSSDKMAVVLVVGVNGVGKTTTIAKLAFNLKSQGKKVVLAAGDTFRAAAIDQLKIWGERTDIPVIASQPGADPGAVVFDALETAAKRKADLVIVDTAGRLHTKYNLMEELKKIKRIGAKSDSQMQVLLVIDANTGQNGLIQAKHFAEAVTVDGIVLAKLDSTAKGGIVFAICDELKIPILFIGTGQELDDIAPFSPSDFVEALFAADGEASR